MERTIPTACMFTWDLVWSTSSDATFCKLDRFETFNRAEMVLVADSNLTSDSDIGLSDPNASTTVVRKVVS